MQTVNIKDFLKSQQRFGTNHGQVVSKTPFEQNQIQMSESGVIEKTDLAKSEFEDSRPRVIGCREEGNFFKCYDIADFNSASYVTSMMVSSNSNTNKDISSPRSWDKVSFEKGKEPILLRTPTKSDKDRFSGTEKTDKKTAHETENSEKNFQTPPQTQHKAECKPASQDRVSFSPRYQGTVENFFAPKLLQNADLQSTVRIQRVLTEDIFESP